ncbi:MAG: peptidoglycan-binding domain-containing protein [Candidatus Moranbacteria bacterium]|nr:peptidoglycan-binding domain-containing protein [Candidatus Moranbacteria bacterium]
MTKIKKVLILMLVILTFSIGTNKVKAGISYDFSEPFQFGSYTINMPVILAQDSILWDLLTNFDRLSTDGVAEYENCVTVTEAFILANGAEMASTFPWMWDDGDANTGAQSFCDIIDMIPDYMESQLIDSGIDSPTSGVTTNLWDPNITPDWHSVEGLVIDSEFVRVEFTREIDLLSYEFVNMVLDFVSAFDASTGYLSLDSDLITGLRNTSAIITFKNLQDLEDPAILVDGELNEDVISAVVYDSTAKTIAFNTQHFSSFEVVESSSIAERAKIESWKAEKYQPDTEDRDTKVRIKIKGKRFDEDAKVFIGGKEADRINRRTSNEIVAWFHFDDIDKKYDPHRKVYVENPGTEKSKSAKKINVRKIDWKIETNNFESNDFEGVLNIQKALFNEGLFVEENIIGIYGPITTSAIKQFQAKFAIPQTGLAGPLTIAKMIEENN